MTIKTLKEEIEYWESLRSRIERELADAMVLLLKTALKREEEMQNAKTETSNED